MRSKNNFMALLAAGSLFALPAFAQTTTNAGSGQQANPTMPGATTSGPATTGGLPTENTQTGAMNGSDAMGANGSAASSNAKPSKKMKHKKSTDPQT